jgi:hypothetical protein
MEKHDWLLDYAREQGWRVGWTCKMQPDGKFTVWCWVKTDLIERPYRFGIHMQPSHSLEQGVESSAGLAFGAIGPMTTPWMNDHGEEWKPSWLRESRL